MKFSRFRNSPVPYFVLLLNKALALFQNCSLFHSNNIAFSFSICSQHGQWVPQSMPVCPNRCMPCSPLCTVDQSLWLTPLGVDFLQLAQWVGWCVRWTLVILGLGRSVCMWEYDQGCLCDFCFVLFFFVWFVSFFVCFLFQFVCLFVCLFFLQ